MVVVLYRRWYLVSDVGLTSCGCAGKMCAKGLSSGSPSGPISAHEFS
jgi:hypothetical protein